MKQNRNLLTKFKSKNDFHMAMLTYACHVDCGYHLDPDYTTPGYIILSFRSEVIKGSLGKTMTSHLPLFLEGEVIKGFGRGSKELGCPTANYPQKVVESLPEGTEPGVYYGWAQVDSGDVHKMVANIGWCPVYNNREMSIETHVMHEFDDDFYGSNLKICIVGYLRGEKNFKSVEELKDAIQIDINNAAENLEDPSARDLKRNDFFLI